jgi:hypothetical protein
MKKGQVIIEVVDGVEGPSLYIGDEDGGHRLAGTKPWGGGQTIHKFIVDVEELQQESARFEKKKQKHDYVVTHNQDGTFSVALPDSDELRIVPPQQRKPLTDEHIDEIASFYYPRWQGHQCFARAIEAAHGIKENT